MARTFKVLSVLLGYPGEATVEAAPEMAAVLRQEGLLRPRDIERIEVLLDELVALDLYDLQERYGLLFDRTRSLSLHLFEHVHGESRERGQAMVDLQILYRTAGMEIGTSELPDYLPLFLEFLSTRELPEALDLLAEPAHILSALADRLAKRSSTYAAVLEALVALAGADAEATVARLAAIPDDDPNDLAALDAQWMDEEVRFGPGALDQCGKESLIPRLRAATRGPDAPDPARRHGPQTIITHSASRTR